MILLWTQIFHDIPWYSTHPIGWPRPRFTHWPRSHGGRRSEFHSDRKLAPSAGALTAIGSSWRFFIMKLGDFTKWVCLKMVYPFVPNGFADHYPYLMAISLGVYPIFRHTQMSRWSESAWWCNFTILEKWWSEESQWLSDDIFLFHEMESHNPVMYETTNQTTNGIKLPLLTINDVY